MSAYESELLKLKHLKFHQTQELKTRELDLTQELKMRELNLTQELKMRELDLTTLRIKMEQEERQKDREFIRKENNKNRVMYVKNRFNKYLDMQVYGSPTAQYITQNSITDIIGYNIYLAMADSYVPEINNQIKEFIEPYINKTLIYENGITKLLSVVSIDNVENMIDNLCNANYLKSNSKIIDNLLEVKNKVLSVPISAIRDEHRYLKNTYKINLENQNKQKNNKKLDKQKYIKAENDAHFENGKCVIKCYCCFQKIELDDISCHRSHNIPDSKGGDLSPDNIRLCCATCNSSMNDSLTIDEYKCQLYVKLLGKVMHPIT